MGNGVWGRGNFLISRFQFPIPYSPLPTPPLLRHIHARRAQHFTVPAVSAARLIGHCARLERDSRFAGAGKAGIMPEPGAVTDEMRRGYLWDGEVLRPARVQVAK